MDYSQIKKELQKNRKFSLHGLAYQGFCRPHLAAKILFYRLKFRLTKSPTLITTKLFFDEEMIIKFPEEISEVLFLHHFYEYELTSIILSYLKPGMIFADVGAHFGYYSLLASKILSKNGKVHSFEPVKDTYDILCKNMSKRNNVITNQNAVWFTNTKLEFHDYGVVLAAYNSFTKARRRNFEGNFKTTYIQAITLDTYFKNEYPDFVKIDVESAELEVLKGMRKIIENKHPYISVEVGEIIEGTPSSKKCVEYLLDRNYEVFESRGGILQRHTVKNSYEWDNLFFIYKN